MLLNRIRPNIEVILRKNQNGFRQNRSTTGQILKIQCIIEGVKSKNLLAILSIVNFAKAFDSIHRGKINEFIFDKIRICSIHNKENKAWFVYIS